MCHALTQQDTPCIPRGSLAHFTMDGQMVQAVLCGNHYKMVHKGKTLRFHIQPRPFTYIKSKEANMAQPELFPQSIGTHEVISDLRMRINAINNQAHTHAQTKENTMDIMFRPVVKIEERTLRVLPTPITLANMEKGEIKDHIAHLLEQHADECIAQGWKKQRTILGYAGRIDNRTWLITPEKSVLTNLSIVAVRIVK